MLVPLARAQRHKRLTRPQRRKAIGGGRQFGRDEADDLLMTIVWLRISPPMRCWDICLVSRIVPPHARLPAGCRCWNSREVPELLMEMPQVAGIIDAYAQRSHRPRDHTEADT